MSEITKAITAVMADIKRLGKGERNSHANYNFASIDDFLDLTRPLCAAHGLTVLQDEEDCQIVDAGGGNKSLFMRFAFTLEAGGESRGPLRRSIMVPAKMGSQAFGAGQSYALKQFLRATFQIATGEKDDIDHHDTGELPSYGASDPGPPRQPQPREKLDGPFATKTALKRAADDFHRDLRGCGDQDMLLALVTSSDVQALKEQLRRDWPGYLNGDGMPDEFEPINTLYNRLKRELPEAGNMQEAAE